MDPKGQVQIIQLTTILLLSIKRTQWVLPSFFRVLQILPAIPEYGSLMEAPTADHVGYGRVEAPQFLMTWGFSGN